MKKSICPQLPNSAVWSVKDWVMTHRGSNYTIFVPVRDGESPTTSTLYRCVFDTTEETMESTASGQKDLFDTTDLQNKTCLTT